MKTIITCTVYFCIASFCIGQRVNAQDQTFSKSSLTTGFGVGFSSSNQTEGVGYNLTLGFHRDFGGRLRFNPFMNIGQYSSSAIDDARDQFFNSVNVGAILFYDFIRFGSTSLTIGIGGLLNHTNGLKGTGGDRVDLTDPFSSEYVNTIQIAAYAGLGIRINPPENRVVFSIMPLNIHTGTNSFNEVFAKAGIEIKLR